MRQRGKELPRVHVFYIHLTLMPYIPSAGELKTKPTQHSVKELLSIGIQPDIRRCNISCPGRTKAVSPSAMGSGLPASPGSWQKRHSLLKDGPKTPRRRPPRSFEGGEILACILLLRVICRDLPRRPVDVHGGGRWAASDCGSRNVHPDARASSCCRPQS
jgi:hypothetical protein